MPFCHQCGSALSEGANFCPSCGAKGNGVPSVPPIQQNGQKVRTVFCKKCKTHNPANDWAIAKGKGFARWWENIITIVLICLYIIPVIPYLIYLWVRKVRVCPNCGAKMPLKEIEIM